ncbi:ABC transporter permease [Olivibacter sp. XZL3]|uniref:ABC transporter permease n=1 Tax=Olivibacter sp. XZL3 TaxID=1735116 RepID=UPI0010663BEB|nr:ABC transporter permease [Olivibacter sp. XZL3]
MIQNYLKIAWRNLRRNPVQASVHIIGLSIGISVTLFVALWVWDELSFDKQHKHYERIAKVALTTRQHHELHTSTLVAAPLAEGLRTTFKNQFESVALARVTGEHVLRFDEQILKATGKFIEAEGTAILPMVMLGGIRNGLQKPNNIMLSESMARAIFGNLDPIGKVIKIDDTMLASVSGVYEDFPHNSSFYGVKHLLPWALLTASNKDFKRLETSWEFNWFEVLVALNPATTMEKASAEIKNFQRHVLKDQPERSTELPTLSLYPMEQWHLYNEWENGKPTAGMLKFVRLFALIGLFVLLLACVNFINLSTANAQKRAKEVGVRKAIGSDQKQLMLQFLCESVFITGLAYVLALVLVSFGLPYFNTFAEKSLHLPVNKLNFHFLGMAFVLCVGILAGTYPALVLASFSPISSLRNVKIPQSGFQLRQVLIVFQFTVTAVLMIGTYVIHQQINHAKNRPVGYNRNDLISFHLNKFNGTNEALHRDLLATGVLTSTCQATSPATDVWSHTSGFHWEGKTAGFKDDFSLLAVSPSYGKTLGWEIVDGRDFSKDFLSDSLGIIVNESAVKYMGIKDPIGKTVQWKDETFNNGSYTIIGVIKDMVMQSPYEPVHQTIYFMQPAANFLIARLKPGIPVQDALQKIRTVFRQHIPNQAFDVRFVQEEFDRKFSFEEKVGDLAFISTLLTLFISCLGIHGLMTLLSVQRAKEIGIRKVLGAALSDVLILLSKDFVRLVLIAVLIASPIAWWAMKKWLEDFTYRVEIQWWVFMLAGIFALVISLLTVCIQAIRAALANPVDSLRNE